MKSNFSFMSPFLLLCFLFPTRVTQAQTSATPKTKASRSAAGFTITVATDKGTYSDDEHISLTATLQNTGKEDKLVVNSYSLLSMFTIKVFSVDGKELSMTDKGKAELFNACSIYGRSIGIMNPGVKLEYTYSSLDHLYDLTPGKYQIILSRGFPKDDNPKEWTTLSSNTVEITVETAPPKAEPDAAKPATAPVDKDHL